MSDRSRMTRDELVPKRGRLPSSDPDDFDLRLDSALSAAPEVDVPLEFAARVAAMGVSAATSLSPSVVLSPPRYGRAAMVMSVAVTLLALLLSAPALARGSYLLTLTLQWLLAAEVVAVAALSLGPWSGLWGVAE